MKVIVGLGNPGAEYERTRHNVGWWVVDHLADVWHFDGWRRDGEARDPNGTVAGAKVRLIKPLTYMNLSGTVLRNVNCTGLKIEDAALDGMTINGILVTELFRAYRDLLG